MVMNSAGLMEKVRRKGGIRRVRTEVRTDDARCFMVEDCLVEKIWRS
jgi:hypothetical protein